MNLSHQRSGSTCARGWIKPAVGMCVLSLHALLAAEAPAPIVYEEARSLGSLDGTLVRESSGVACGRINPGAVWTHNDSGAQPHVFAFSHQGELLGEFRVTGATLVDWEDIATVAVGKKGYILIADVGDNNRQRKDCCLYWVQEPLLKKPRPDTGADPKRKPFAASKTTKPAPEKKTAGDSTPSGRRGPENTAAADVLKFQYEDGPHNCESAAMDPETLRPYLVSKEDGNVCKVYELPSQKEWKHLRGSAVARKIGELKIPTTTGMDISPDATRAIICTYGNAFEYTRDKGESWQDAFRRAPREIPLPPRPQGESIAYGPDGRSLLLTSEIPKNQEGNVPLLLVPARKSKTETAPPP